MSRNGFAPCRVRRRHTDPQSHQAYGVGRRSNLPQMSRSTNLNISDVSQSTHARNSISCVACHKVHAKGPNALVARKANEINEQCAKCHQNVWAAFQKPNHHRLPEGAMSCVDCHNPHGSIRPAMGRQVNSNDPGCFRCHGDKRGPFTFEHAPVRFEGCTTCHDPHGSVNPEC